MQLDGRIEWRRAKLELSRNWYIPALAVSYGVHRVFRRYAPRRFAPWTSMGLSELYILSGVGISLTLKILESTRAAYNDDDLAALAVAGSRAGSASVRRSIVCEDAIQSDPRVRELARSFRTSSYATAHDPSSKVSWWARHILADKVSYDAVATTIIYRSLQADPAWTPRHLSDFDICTNFIATNISNRSEDITHWIGTMFVATIPAAIDLRESGGRAWYLPMNIAQRLLLGLTVYIMTGLRYHNWNHLQGIKDKQQVATAVVRAFGSLEEEIAKARNAVS
ncbi:hypothetical protein OH76DRAFT_1024301 [Lentinus brumalis]|uniref:Uncharacterized protein n=1 Tax=Lentinus brumalis TaxID=2498619 RepID=A0A371CXL5_9APHY|nr:hypothetical protein OH76DRAFT_1024301 [Polyporus brumalis]